MAFRIDVLDASNNKVGTGPLTTVEAVSIRRSLDRIGGASLTLPGTDPKTAVVGIGRKYAIYHSRWGNLGTFSHKRQSLAVSGHTPKLKVDTQDALVELVKRSVYYRRNFDDVAVDSVVSTLLALVPGWGAGEVESGIGDTTLSYEGESVYEALDILRDRWGKSFRLGSSDQTLDFGSFGDDSGVRLIRAEAMTPEMDANADVALVTNLDVITEGETIINRVIPVGAGAGVTQLTLEHVTVSDADYPVQSGLNADGSNFYYIEDATSQANYGLVERPFERSDIRPLTNATVNLQNAANALYQAALAFLLKSKDPRTEYQVSVTKLDPARLKPGDTVRLFYRGIANREGRPYKWVDVDADLWILDLEETYNADNSQAVKLTIGTSTDRRTRDEDVMATVVRDAKVAKTHVQPNLTHSPVGPYVKRIDDSNNVTFNIRLKEEVLAVNRVICRFITAPLRSSVRTSQGESAHTHVLNVGLGGAHSHIVNVGLGGAHSHIVNVGLGGSHAHTVNVGLGGAHAHTVNVGLGGGHTHTLNVGLGGDHNHDSLTINRVLPASLTGNDKQIYFHQNDEDIKFPSNDAGPSSHTKTSSSEQHSHPGESALSATHSHPGESALSATHSHPGQSALSVSHSHPGQSALSVSHSHPGQSALSADHSHPGETAQSVSHSHPGESALSAQHSHPGETAVSAQHSHPGETAVSAQHSHPGESALSTTHSHPGESALSTQHSHPGESALSTTHSHPGEATEAGSAHAHAMDYGLFEDATHPQIISIAINGIDRTGVLGGTWAPSNAAIDIEVDITEYVFRGQDNTVTFSCTTGQGELTFLADCLLTIQAIAVT